MRHDPSMTFQSFVQELPIEPFARLAVCDRAQIAESLDVTSCTPVLDLFGHVTHIQLFAVREHDHSLYGVLQFPNVTWPRIVDQTCDGLFCDSIYCGRIPT
jgi:hypothetical protein